MKISRITPQFSVTTMLDSNSGDYYSLYVNGSWYNTYTSLEQVTAAIQALIMGVVENDVL